MANEQYLIQRRNRRRNKYRFLLGLEQIIYVPLWNLLLIPIVDVFRIMWEWREKMLSTFNLPVILLPVYEYLSFTIVILILLLLLLLFVVGVAELTARGIEGDLQEAFTLQDIQEGGYPILISKRKVRNTKVKRYVFYSAIPLETWMLRKKNIISSHSIHFIEDISYYKGKGRKIALYVSKGVESKKQGDIYDGEF